MAEYVLYLTTPTEIRSISPIIISDTLYNLYKDLSSGGAHYITNSKTALTVSQLDGLIFTELNNVIPEIVDETSPLFYKIATNTVYPYDDTTQEMLQSEILNSILNKCFNDMKLSNEITDKATPRQSRLNAFKIYDRNGFEFPQQWCNLSISTHNIFWGAATFNNNSSNQSSFPYTGIYVFSSNEIRFYFPVLPSSAVENNIIKDIPPDNFKSGVLGIQIQYQPSTFSFRLNITINNTNILVMSESARRAYYWSFKNSDFDYWHNYGALDTSGYVPTPDPYYPGGTSGTGGGGGTYNTNSDSIPVPSLPTLDAVKAGFISLYTPTLAQLNNLASYMWSDSFDVNTFKKIFADPMDAIIGLSIVPGNVPTAGTDSIKIGFIDTGVSMNKAATQYASLDCGTLDIQNFFGSFLDYSPYTKFSIFLPYIGTRQLDTDDIMGKQLHLVYNIDYLTGTLCAMLEVNGAVLYEFSGSCAASIPLTGQNFTQMIVSGIQLATSITAGVATAGATTAANVASTAGMLGSTAGTVAGMKPSIQKTGAVSGAAGMLGVQTPYLIWEIPRQALPENFNTFYGYPANITKVLKDCSGYTEIDDIHIYNIYATDAELREIESLLKGGVII